MAIRWVGGLAALVVLGACGDAIVFLGDVPARMRLVAGVPGEQGATVGPTALESRFQAPSGVARASDGVVFVADGAPARILRIELDGSVATLYDLRECASDCILRPAGMALLPTGELLVADPAGHRVWRVDPISGNRTPFAGTGVAESGTDGADRLSVGLMAPADIAIAPDGSVYVAEGGARKVRSISPDGMVGTVAGTGEAGDDGDGGPGATATLLRPTGLALWERSLFVADSAAHRVRRIDLDGGTIEAAAGSGSAGFFGDGRDALAARFSAPVGLSVSDDGLSLYIADSGNHRVRVLDRADAVVRTFAGTGETTFNGDGHTAGATALSAPWDVALEAGVLVVVDREMVTVWRTDVIVGSQSFDG